MSGQSSVRLADFGIEDNLHQIKIKSKSAFLNLVKRKAKEYALGDFLNKKENHSKMGELFYCEVKMQNYLSEKKPIC